MLRKYRLETSRCFSKTIHVSMQSASVLRRSNVFLTALTSSLTGGVYGLISLRPNKADKKSGVDLRWLNIWLSFETKGIGTVKEEITELKNPK